MGWWGQGCLFSGLRPQPQLSPPALNQESNTLRVLQAISKNIILKIYFINKRICAFVQPPPSKNSNYKKILLPDVIGNTCNPSTPEAKAGASSQVQG